jgi:hypothetical protein
MPVGGPARFQERCVRPFDVCYILEKDDVRIPLFREGEDTLSLSVCRFVQVDLDYDKAVVWGQGVFPYLVWWAGWLVWGGSQTSIGGEVRTARRGVDPDWAVRGARVSTWSKRMAMRSSPRRMERVEDVERHMTVMLRQ